jgi:hypothetical protein
VAIISVDKLTLDEVERIEELTGLRMEQMMRNGEVPSAKVIKAFTLIALQRRDPSATIEDAAKMTYMDSIELIGADDDDAPKAVRNGARKKPAPNSKPPSPSSTAGPTPTSGL